MQFLQFLIPSRDKELQELRSYQNLFQEDEFTQEDNTSSNLEQLEESNYRSKSMEEILDNVVSAEYSALTEET